MGRGEAKWTKWILSGKPVFRSSPWRIENTQKPNSEHRNRDAKSEWNEEKRFSFDLKCFVLVQFDVMLFLCVHSVNLNEIFSAFFCVANVQSSHKHFTDSSSCYFRSLQHRHVNVKWDEKEENRNERERREKRQKNIKMTFIFIRKLLFSGRRHGKKKHYFFCRLVAIVDAQKSFVNDHRRSIFGSLFAGSHNSKTFLKTFCFFFSITFASPFAQQNDEKQFNRSKKFYNKKNLDENQRHAVARKKKCMKLSLPSTESDVKRSAKFIDPKSYSFRSVRVCVRRCSLVHNAQIEKKKKKTFASSSQITSIHFTRFQLKSD